MRPPRADCWRGYGADNAAYEGCGYLARVRCGDPANLQAGRDLNITMGAPAPTQHLIAALATKPRSDAGPVLCVHVRGVHSGTTATIQAPENESILSLTERARVALGFRYEARVDGSLFPFRLRWVLVDERAVEDWKALPIHEKQRNYALIKLGPELRSSLSPIETLKLIGIHDGLEARLFPIQEDDSPTVDRAMLSSR